MPKPDPGTKRAKIESATPRLSRLDQLKKDRVAPRMPSNPAPHLIDRLMEIGLCDAGGMSAAPVSWREINEWQQATGIALEPWEARLIRKLSTEYLAEGRRAESENCPPPYRTEVTACERDLEEARLRMLLG